MFWSLAYAGNSAIDTILTSSSGFTLEQLLEEDELLQECKSQNTKLIEFLVQPETMHRLLCYIIEMPEETDSEARRFKYPFVASEVLASDVPVLRDELFAVSRHHIEQLLSVLQQPPPLAPVLAGYCSKVVISLFKSSPEKFLMYFNELWASDSETPLSLAKLLPRLLLHLGSDAVLQMLNVLCVGEPTMAEPGVMQMQTASVASWIPHSQLVPALLDNLSCENPEAAQNSAQLLISVLDGTTGMLGCLSDPDEAARSRCHILVANCLGGELSVGGGAARPFGVVLAGLGASDTDPACVGEATLLRLCYSRPASAAVCPGRIESAQAPTTTAVRRRLPTAQAVSTPVRRSVAALAVGELNLPALDVLLRVLARSRDMSLCGQTSSCADALLDAVNEGIDCFFIALATPVPLPPRIRRFLPERDLDALPRPQAPQRCKLLSLFEEALRAKHGPVMQALRQLGLFQVVLDLLLLPHTCNAVHMHAANIIEATLKMEGEEAMPMLQALLHDAQLPVRLVEFCESTMSMSIRPPCYAFVIMLTGILREVATREAEVKAALDACEGWMLLISPEGALGSWDAIHARPLGGRLPARSSDMDDDSDDSDMSASARDVERALAMQAATLRERAEQARSENAFHDDEDDEDVSHSSAYLEHFAQYLSQRNFVNDMSHGLDAALQEAPLDDSANDSQWCAEFDTDSGWPDATDGAPHSEGSAANGVAIVSAPASAAAVLLEFDDEPDSVPLNAVGTPSTKTNWDTDFEQVLPASDADAAGTAGWAAAFLPTSDTAVADDEDNAVDSPKATDFDMAV